MNTQPPPLADLTAAFDHLQNEMTGRIQSVAAELRRDPPLDVGRIEGEILELTNQTRAFFAFFQAMSQARVSAATGPASLEWQAFQTRAGLIRLAVNQWPRIRDLIRQQAPSKRRALFRKPSPSEDLIRSQEEIEDRLLDTLHKVLNPKQQSEPAGERGCFDDIALPGSLFAQHMHAARRVLLAQGKMAQTAFIDVGCGGGLKVLTAAALFDRAVGLEFDAGFAASARRLFKSAGATNCQVIRTDAHTFRNYADFDLIYLFRPMQDDGEMAALEERIVAQAKPDAILVAPYLGFHHRHRSLGCSLIADALFLARASKREAVKLRRRAEFMGTGLPPAEPAKAPPSIWDPILAAAQARGFYLGEDRPRLPA